MPIPPDGTPMSAQEYFALEYSSPPWVHHELIEGRIYAMSGGSIAHDKIAHNAYGLLDSHFGENGPCHVYGSDVRVLVDAKQEYYYPDVTVTCDVADNDPSNTMIRSPSMVVEVHSPSTVHRDLNEKWQAYQARESMVAIVFIEQGKQEITVYAREEITGQWLEYVYGPGEHVLIPAFDFEEPIEQFYKGLPTQGQS